MNNELAVQIRTKKLAVLIRDARKAAGRAKKECAEALGVSSSIYNRYENGVQAPSLPELEALAFYLDVPIDHFWGKESIFENQNRENVSERIARSLELRQRIISVKLHQAREKAGISLTQLAEQTGIPRSRLKKFEAGESQVPLPELEILISLLEIPMQEISGGQGPVGEWLREQTIMRQLMDMPQELQEFVSRPVNRPYLEIALKLSNMEVNRLRTVAEGLLDITL